MLGLALVAAAGTGIGLGVSAGGAARPLSTATQPVAPQPQAPDSVAVSGLPTADTTTVASSTTTSTTSLVPATRDTATTIAGVGPQLSTTTTTAPAAPEPTDVVAYSSADRRTATVTWSAPTGPVARYTVSTNPSSGSPVTVTAPQTTAHLSGLVVNQPYTVSVEAVSAAGASSPAATTTLVNGAVAGQTTFWSQPGGNYMNTGQSTIVGPASGPNTYWGSESSDVPTDGFPWSAQPSVGPNGDVYAFGHDGLLAFSPSGSLLWQQALKPGPNLGAGSDNWPLASALNQPVVGPDGSVYLIAQPGLDAISPAGQVLWTITAGPFTDGNETGPPFVAAPTVGPDGTIYLVTQSAVEAINPANGSVEWSWQGQDMSPWGAVLSPDGSVVYVGDSYDQLAAIKNGKLQWTYAENVPRDGFSQTSRPVVGPDGDVYVAGADSAGTVTSISPAGQVLWTQHANVSPPVLTSTGLLVAGTATGMTAWNARTGALVWSSNQGNERQPVAVGANGTIYFTGNDYVGAVSNDGDQLWTGEGCGCIPMNTAALVPSGGLVWAENAMPGPFTEVVGTPWIGSA